MKNTNYFPSFENNDNNLFAIYALNMDVFIILSPDSNSIQSKT